ncbi:MAG: class I SAM-dependent methyltransferase [Xanthomonadaceae bacterium]|nr:class I SAM-dependent methyltransferase [Xanthomonadaceae bacterium]
MIRQNLIYSYSLGRGALFLSEMVLLKLFTKIFAGGTSDFNPPKELVNQVRQSLFDLLKEDAKKIEDGVFPLSVLYPESPLSHLKRLPKLFWDGLGIEKRRSAGRTTVFSDQAKDEAKNKPIYFKRNFHFQTDGYFSDHSAEIYDHQVEMLFTGAADAMRRMLITEIKKRSGKTDGEGLKILELAAGSGSSSKFIHMAFPKTRLTVSDLSESYLDKAKFRLKAFKNIDYIIADAADLPFRDNEYDVIVCTFLFHEMPLEVRKQVLKESLRVLKPGGIFAAVDSTQYHDRKEFNVFLEQFPIEYHEPFYRNYCENPMEDMLREAPFADVQSRSAFFAKAMSGIKSCASS